MSSSLTQDFPPSRWDEMCSRLEPLIGDVKQALGPQWHERAETFFTEADFIVAETILRGSTSVPDWFVIRYTPAGLHLDSEREGITCASSWPDGLAVLLDTCERNRCLPSRVECDSNARTLKLFVAEELLATLMPLPAAYVSPAHRQRAMSTITGLRKSSNTSAALLKRARQWPGMSKLLHVERHTDHDMQELREQMAHQPIPREWLRSAQMLCAACALHSPDTATVQSVAAAALGAKSWNHLAGPLGNFSMRLLQPWYVRKDDEIYELHADAIDAVASLFHQGPQLWTEGWAGVALESRCSYTAPDYVPNYILIETSLDSSRRTFDERQVAAYPVYRSKPNEVALARVSGLTLAAPDAIAALFGVGLPVDFKARMLDERLEERLIVQDGPWRFTRSGGPIDRGAFIWVYRVGIDGNSIWSAGVPAYKGLLQIHRETGCYVLCADYDGANPVAVIDELSPVAAAQVRASLPDTSQSRLEFKEHLRSKEDIQDFRSLLEATLSRRSRA